MIKLKEIKTFEFYKIFYTDYFLEKVRPTSGILSELFTHYVNK